MRKEQIEREFQREREREREREKEGRRKEKYIEIWMAGFPTRR